MVDLYINLLSQYLIILVHSISVFFFLPITLNIVSPTHTYICFCFTCYKKNKRAQPNIPVETSPSVGPCSHCLSFILLPYCVS